MRRAIALCVLGLTAFAACGGGTEPAAQDPQAKEVEDVIRASVRAEKAKDVDTFLSHWTDKGLAAVELSRADLKSGKTKLEEPPPDPVAFPDTNVIGDAATVVVHAKPSGPPDELVGVLVRMRFSLIRREGTWLIDGFRFMGGAPPPAGAEVLKVTALDYAFGLAENEIPGEFAVELKNTGKEGHQVVVFQGPEGTTLLEAKKDLEKFPHSGPPKLEGYRSGFLAFADPGQTVKETLSDALDEGKYFLACLLPEGGVDERGEPKNPDAKLHVALGMIAEIEVTSSGS